MPGRARPRPATYGCGSDSIDVPTVGLRALMAEE